MAWGLRNLNLLRATALGGEHAQLRLPGLGHSGLQGEQRALWRGGEGFLGHDQRGRVGELWGHIPLGQWALKTSSFPPSEMGILESVSRRLLW